MEIAEKELQNIIAPDKPKEITPQLIIEVVAEHYQISIDQMVSKARSNSIAKPRQIAMYLCKQMTSQPLDSIGQLLGGRIIPPSSMALRKLPASMKQTMC